MGVTVSKKHCGAVTRNRVKRLVREAFRAHKERWPVDRDLVFVAKTHAEAVTHAMVVTELEQLCRRIPRASAGAPRTSEPVG